jgi:hypothetical protein
MVADKVRDYYDKQAKERQRVRKGDQPGASVANLPHLDSGKARDAAGKALGVSGKLVDRARTVREKGVPELAQAVEEGRMSVTRASDLTDEDESEQREVAKGATQSGGHAPAIGGARVKEGSREYLHHRRFRAENGRAVSGAQAREKAPIRVEYDQPG